MSERGLGPLACLITDLLIFLFLYVKLFSGDGSSTGNTVFHSFKLVQRSLIWQHRTMKTLPFAKYNRDCERGWAVTFIFVHVCWLDLRGLFALQFSVIASVEHLFVYFPISRERLHIVPPFVFFTQSNSRKSETLLSGVSSSPLSYFVIQLKDQTLCSRSVSNFHFDFRPCVLSFLSVIFSLSSPHIIFLSQSVLHAGSSGSARDELSLCGSRICHEVAHSWFGLVIGAKDWTEEWISEGFATYLEDVIWAKAQKARWSSHCLIAGHCNYSL